MTAQRLEGRGEPQGSARFLLEPETEPEKELEPSESASSISQGRLALLGNEMARVCVRGPASPKGVKFLT